ncbi:MAG: septum formation protein Maf [Victivallales bacterium]|nr:septum formation protein Maf [Victivallales bacterium]
MASGSPRRAALLRQCGVPFEVQPADVDEDAIARQLSAQGRNSPRQLVQALAMAKAKAGAQANPGRLALGSDTVVALRERILGKPRDMDEAFATLRLLSGQTHEVHTGVAFVRDNQTWIGVCTTSVQFQDLDDQRIHDYLRLVNPLDKAGSYAVQEHGDLIVAKVEGSHSNVIGLPIHLAAQCLPHSLLQPRQPLTKKILDLSVSLLLLLLLWPLFLLLAMLVRLSSGGPVIYASHRLGLQGRPFRIYKFRTMVSHAEDMLEQTLSESPEKAQEWRRRFKISQDPRVTPVGRFLRKTSLDELPQLWNVLRGEMSLVGPRPIVDEERQRYGLPYELLAQARPGMTGLWQVSGRSRLSYSRRVALDTDYLLHWSIGRDLGILLRTIPVVFSGDGAV